MTAPEHARTMMNWKSCPDDADVLLPVPIFCGRANIGRTTAWRMRRDGELRFVRLTRRKVAIPLSELRRLIAERTEGGQALEVRHG